MGKTKKSTVVRMKQWAKLYEIAGQIKQVKPWEVLWDCDIITILLPEQKEPVYISVMGKDSKCLAIGVYPGFESLRGLYQILEAENDEPPFFRVTQQNCLMLYYGDREEVTPQDREVMNALGLKFRGKGNWVYFRAMKEGYFPWFLDAQQVDLMIEALQNFYIAFQHLALGEVEVDFENDETLLRFYSEERKQWINCAQQKPPLPPEKITYVTLTDEFVINKLKNQKSSLADLELDLFLHIYAVSG